MRKCAACRNLGDYYHGYFMRDPHYECELEWHLTGWEKRLEDISRVPDDCPIIKYGLENIYKDNKKDSE